MISNKIKVFLLLIFAISFLPFLSMAESFSPVTLDFYVEGNTTNTHFQTTSLSELNYPNGHIFPGNHSDVYTNHKVKDSAAWAEDVFDAFTKLEKSIYNTCMGGKIVVVDPGENERCDHGRWKESGCSVGHTDIKGPLSGTYYIGLCPSLKDEGISISASTDNNSVMPGQPAKVGDGQILYLKADGSRNFTISWDCGSDPNATTNWGDSNSALWTDKNNYTTPTTHIGSENVVAAKEGIYIYKLTCTGIDHEPGLIYNNPPTYINQPLESHLADISIGIGSFYGWGGSGNPTYSNTGVPGTIKVSIVDNLGILQNYFKKSNPAFLQSNSITKTVKVYVGDIPPAPVINDFSFVTTNTDLEISTSTPSTVRLKIGKSFQVHWDVSNVDADKVGTTTNPITIYQMINGLKTPLFSTNEPSGTKTITPKLTNPGYSIGIDVVNPKFLKLHVDPVKNLLLNVYNPAVAQTVNVQFSATKTSITKGESSTLTWSADAAKTVNITPNIGSVSASGGTLDVNPTVTTNYTLTATSVYSDVGPTTKVLTIRVGNATTTLAESITNEADCLANNYYWYNNSCHDSPQIVAPPEETFGQQPGAPTSQVTDIKANGSDGPVTLQSPATFKLSWNINSYCLATGSWLDVKFAAGNQSMTVNKNGKYTYSLYCPGYGSDSVEVDVVGGTGANANTGLLDSLSGNNKDSLSNAPMPVAEAMLSTDKINYSQNITVIKGRPTDIYIAADRDTSGDGLASRDETGQWTDLMSNGGRCLYNTNLVKGTPQFDGMIESPSSVQACNSKLGSYVFNDQPGTYQYGVMELMENNSTFSNIAYVNITVENPPPQTGAPAIDLRINNNDSAEQILGTPASYSLNWNVTNADTCEASGSWSGEKDLQGNQSFVSSGAKNFTYTLNCVGQLGTTTKSIALEVMESPVCQFTALPPTISKQSAFVTQSELSWKCDYADECSISPDIGIPVKTYGSTRVSPDQTTTYELNCLNAATSTKFDATVSVQ